MGELNPPAPVIRLDIVLPEPIELKHNGLELFAWDLDGYGLILEIFNGYTIYADNYISESENDSLWQIRVDVCEQNRELEEKNFNLAINHRDTMYELWYEHERDYDKELRKQKFKSIIIGTGIGVVGVAAGIILGFVITKD